MLVTSSEWCHYRKETFLRLATALDLATVSESLLRFTFMF